MTRLGELLAKKSVNKAEVSRRTGINPSRLSELSHNTTTKLRANELYLIALAIDLEPTDVLFELCGHLNLELVK